MDIARTKGIVTVTPEDEMKNVVQLLSKHHFKKLPVIDENHRVVGVISRGDVIRNIQSTILKEWE
jgi:CBS-domain-containing membrane protein